MKQTARVLVAMLGVAMVAWAAEWTPLFDGRTLEGWRRAEYVNGKAEFTVEDGCIVGTTKTGTPNSFLRTDKDYANFILELEYNVPAGINSGIQIRSICDPNVKNGRVHGYQVEIDPSARAWSAGIYDEAGRGWLYNLTHIEKERGQEAAQAARQACKPNDWNHVRVEAVGPHIRTWLNDVHVADLIDDMTPTGLIALQVHSTRDPEPKQIRWRNIRIQNLGETAGTTRDHLGDIRKSLEMRPPADAQVLLGRDTDLSAWTTAGDEPIAWPWKEGVLTIKPGSGSIMTRQDVRDVALHVEFRVNESNSESIQGNGNSGIYIQQRYELQILNSHGRPPHAAECGGIYRIKAPDTNAARPAGEWQSYDIVFRAARWNDHGEKTEDARISVAHNGILIHDNAAIPTKTGAGKPEGPEPGPIELQDHGNPVAFRNIWIRELKTITLAETEIDRAWKTMLAWTYGESRTALIRVENALRDATRTERTRLENRLLDSLGHTAATTDAKRFICRMLERFGSEAAVPALGRLLGHPELATEARKALANMAYESVDVALSEALTLDLPAAAKAGLILSVGRRGRPEDVTLIAPFVNHRNRSIQHAALEALGAIGTPQAEALLRDTFAANRANSVVGQALLACAEQASKKRQTTRAAALCRLLRDEAVDSRIQAGALRILGDSIADEALPDILEALAAEQHIVRDVAVHLVRDLPGTAIITASATRLESLDPSMRVALFNAYTARRDPAAAPAAVAALEDEDDSVKAAAAAVLGRVGTTVHVDALAALAARGGEPGKAAAQALSTMPGTDVADHILAYLNSDATPETKSALLDALVARAAHHSAGAILELTVNTADENLKRDIWRALRDLAQPGDLPAALDAFFTIEDRRVRREAEKAIAAMARKIDDPQARADGLLAGLERAPEAARPAMANLLSLAPGPRAEKALVQLLESPDKACRYEAVKALGGWESAGPYAALKTYAGKTAELTHNVLALRGCVRLLDLDGAMPEETRLNELDALAAAARRPEEKDLLKAAKTSLRITDLKAKNNKPYEFVRRGFEVGNKPYVDREYTFTEIPDVMVTADHIKTAMDDKYSRGDDWLSFTVNRAVTVIVAYDGRARTAPDWLKDWKKLDQTLRSTDRGCDLQLFAKRFPAGVVTVPGNNPVPGVGAMYTIGVSSLPID